MLYFSYMSLRKPSKLIYYRAVNMISQDIVISFPSSWLRIGSNLFLMMSSLPMISLLVDTHIFCDFIVGIILRICADSDLV